MDNRTLLAIILSVVVVSGYFIVNNVLSPHKPAPVAAAPAPTAPAAPAAPVAPLAPALTPAPAAPAGVVQPETDVLENNVIKMTFTNEGAFATSILLKKYKELDGSDIEMVHSASGHGGAFQLSIGGFDAAPLAAPFQVVHTGPRSIEFHGSFLDGKGVPFSLIRTYTLTDNDYLVKVETRIKGDNGQLPVLTNGPLAYTLSYGPQIGPQFKNLTNATAEFRKYYHLNSGNRVEQLGTGWFLFWQQPMNHETMATTDRHSWSAIVGKYFTVIGIPDGTNYTTVFSNKPAADEKDVSRLAYSRPALTSSDTADAVFFYVGPKEENTLKTYDDASANGFGQTDLKLERALEDNWLLGWLVVILKWVLIGFHALLPNWGVAIILLTIAIKLATWPLTAKSYRANAAMQTLQPKMKELQEKYKDDPKKLNEQTMALYQKEGVNPLGGCLPMLLQIPVFFALYSMFNTQFDLRGALFIPGWIPDLSLPESVWHWGFPLPFLNWTDLRVLPFVMAGTQIWTSLLSQPAAGATGQQRILTMGLPLMFVFFMYEMPSGLMVYWCAQNILTVVQQGYINKHFKKAPAPGGKPNLKLAPKKSGTKISK